MNASEHPIEVFARTAGLLGDAVVREFERVWPTASVDIYRPVLTDVLNGLLGRQVRFFAVAADDPHFWQPDFGGIVLRSMTDTLISLRYIGRGGVEIAQRFRDYSMGHVKLQKLHIEKLVDSGALPGDWEDRVDALQRMVDLDRWEEVIPIDIAGWTPESARDLAMATGLKAQYDLFYAPGSADRHNSTRSTRLRSSHC